MKDKAESLQDFQEESALNEQGERKKGYLQLQMRSSKLEAFCEDFSFCVIGLWSPKRAPEDGLGRRWIGWVFVEMFGCSQCTREMEMEDGVFGKSLGMKP
jgi:hypothetical protein